MTRAAFVRKSLQFLCLLAASLSTAYAQLPVTLSTAAPNPARVGDLITITVSGIPAGTLAPSAVSFELTPHDAPFGPTRTVPAESVTAVPLSTNRQIRFRVPAEFQNPSPFTARISLRGTAGSGAFVSASPRNLNILPAPRLTSVTPAAGVWGQNLEVAIRGEYTQFSSSLITAVAFSGTGLTVNSYKVDAATQIINADLSISASAATGPRNLIVTQVGGRQTTLTDAFFVASSTSGSVSISPATCTAGNSSALTITGVGTNFLSAPPAVNLGDGVVLRSLSVVNATRLALTVDCAILAVPGRRNLTVVTGATFVAAPLGFQVLSTNIYFDSLAPSSGRQGQTLARVRGTAVNSNFLQGLTRVSLTGPGNTTLVVGDVTVDNESGFLNQGQFRTDVTIPPSAPVGGYTLRVVTGGETLTFSDAFFVRTGDPQILSFSPSAVVAGRNATIEVAARYFNFNLSTMANFGSGITVDTSGVTITPAPSGPVIRFPITVSATAARGSRTVRLTTTDSREFTFPLNVLASPASLSALTINSGYQGQTYVRVALTGTGTNFVSGTTAVSLVNPNPPGNSRNSLIITRTAVTSPTALEFDLYIPALIAAAPYTLTVRTGEEVLIANAALQVLPSTPVITVSPNSVPQNATQTVTITGQFTNFNANSIVRGSPNAPISIDNVEVLSPTEIRARLISRAANTVPVAVWVETTVPSPAGDYLEHLQVPFGVTTATPARIISISPNSATPGITITVTVTGSGTNFLSGLSQLGLCATVLPGSVIVSSPTSLQARIRVEANVAPQQCDVSVTTQGERAVLVNGLRVTAPPVFSYLIGPSQGLYAQGQSLGVIVGTANFPITAATTFNFGEGIVINQVIPRGGGETQVNLTILPRAQLGPRNITLITNSQSVSSTTPPFSVTPGLATLTIVNPSTLPIGQTLLVSLTGRNSNFQNGLSVPNFGPGISVTAFNVISATTATALIIAPNPIAMALGLRNVSITTEGETATAVNALNITPQQFLSISPNRARQGETLTVALTGQNTNFQAGFSVPNFGAGITVTQFTVTSAGTAEAVITVDRTSASGSRRDVSISTLGETVTAFDALFVDAAPVLGLSISPTFVVQGQTLPVTLTVTNMNLQAGPSVVNFGAGITVSQFTLTSFNTATVQIAVARSSAAGLRNVSITTGGETATAIDALNILAAPPQILSISPGVARRGQTLPVSLSVTNMNLQTGLSTVNFGEGITVREFTVSSAATATALITVANTSATGPRNVSITTGDETATAVDALRITNSLPPSITPNSGQQGQTLDLSVTNESTSFTSLSTISLGEGITQVGVPTISFDTSAVFRVFVDPTFFIPVGGVSRTVRVTTGAQFFELPLAFQVNQGPPTLLSAAPGNVTQGQSATITVTGRATNFEQAGLGEIVFSGIGITLTGGATVLSPTSISIPISVTRNAAPGPRSLAIFTRGRSAFLADAFTIDPGTAVLVSAVAVPASPAQGQTATVTIKGDFTRWTQATQTVSFGEGVLTNTVTAVDDETLNVAITISPLATAGPRTVTVSGGGLVLSGPAFSITAGQARLLSALPSRAKQNEGPFQIVLTGSATNFATGTTLSSPGVTFTNVVINSTTQITATANVPASATVGTTTITATTGAEVAALTGGFPIDSGVPALISATPNATTRQQESFTLTVQGRFTNFAASTTVSLGAGVVVDSVTATSATQLSVAARVLATADAGPRELRVTSVVDGVLTFGSAFTVTAGPAALLSSNPASLRQGATLDVTVLGSATNFLVSTTALNFGPGITVSNLVVNSVTSLSARLTVSDSAATGPRTISATTNGEVATLANFQVNPGVAVVTQLSPNTARQGAVALPLTVTGRFTNFAAGTTASFGAGIIVNSVTPTSTTQAAVVVTIEPNAALGTRNLTLTSGGNSVTFTDALTVTRSDASLVSASPGSVPQGAAQTITVTGLLTNFLTNTTTVAVAGGGITNGLLTIVNPTTLTLALTVSDSAAPGARDITVSTGGEVVTLVGGLTIVPGTPVISTFTPGTIAQQQTVTATFTTRFLTLSAPLTVSFPTDPRISAANVQLLNATQFTADITVQGPAALGLKPLTVTAPGGSATLANAFTVTAGPAAIASFSGASIARNASGTVTVSGIGTSFEAGLTTADFGPGVTTTVTVISPTEATVNAVVAENAAPGVRPLILRTGGETAAPSAGGFTVTAATPFLSSVTPNGFKSNATVIVTVAGQNLSGATFALGGGAAINATSVTTTSTSATFSLNLAGAAIGDYPVVATTVGGSSLTILEPGNTFRVIQASGFAGSDVSVLNIFFDPVNNTPAALRSAFSPPVSVQNIFFDPVNNTPAALRSADAPPVSVQNIFFDPANNTPAALRSADAPPLAVQNIFFDPANNTPAPARSAVAPPVSVLNIFFDPSTVANVSVASSPNLVIHNTAVAPAAISLSAKPEQSATAARSGKLPLTLGLEEKVYPGQSLRLQVADADGQAGSVTTVLANRVAIATLAAGEPELLFTVPYGVANLEIQLLIRDADGTVRSSQPISLAITPDSGQQLAGVARHADGQAAAGVDLALYASGLTAEVFFFEQAVVQRPDLTELSPNRLFVASSVHQPNPEAVFGSDPLGLGRAQDVAVRYKGWLFIEEPGTYRFWLDGRAGASFLLDGKPYNTQAELKAGLHPVEIVYWNGVGPESLAWTWQTPGGRREPVSPQVLRTRLPGSYKTSENGEFILPRVPLAVDTLWLQAGAETNPVVVVIPQPRARQIITKPLEITLPAVQ